MATQFGWGILGPGRIARKFATGLKECETGHLAATGSRELGRAVDFSAEFGGLGYGSYEEVALSDEVDGVYISTPHHLHVEQTILCAEAGKHVLVEKPCALDEAGARRAIEACRANGVMFCEAFMVRMHPRMVAVKEAIRSGRIGRVLHVQSEFGFHADEDWTDVRSVLEYGGGALMDLGCYCVQLARLVFDSEPERCTYLYKPAKKGYDGVASGSMLFPDGGTTSFGSGVHCQMRNDATIYGSEGRIYLPTPWYHGDEMYLYTKGNEEPEYKKFEIPHLYGNQADVFVRSLEKGEVEMMTPEDSLGNMRALDMLRADGGLDFGNPALKH